MFKKIMTMKKEYINPELEVVDLKINCSLLAGSLPKSNEEVTDESGVLAPGFDFFDE